MIRTFRGAYYFLSNFYNAPVTWDGVTYQNNESAFQSAKVIPDGRRAFAELDASDAKKLGRQLIVDMLDHSMKKMGNICVLGIGLVVHHTISFLEINQRELLRQPLQTIGTLLKHSKNIMRIFLMAN